MAWKNRREIDWLKRSLDKSERRAAVSREYLEASSEKMDAECARRIRNFEDAQERRLADMEFGFADKSAAFESFLSEELAKKSASLRMKFRARRESLRRKAKKDSAPDVDSALAAYQSELDAEFSAYESALRAAFEASRPSPESAERAKAAWETERTAFKEARTRKRDALERKFARRKERRATLTGKRIARYERQAEKTRAVLAEKLANTDAGRKLEGDTVLEVEHLCMYFGGLHAVEDLSFSVKRGEIFGLIGPNGAGKTTVFNCITQFYKVTSGNIFFLNKQGETVDMNRIAVHDVILEGIVRTFQNVEVVREITVLENLLVAATRQYTSNLFEQMLHLPILRQEEIVIRRRADRVLNFLGLEPYRDMIAFGLPYGILKKIEIARTLMCDPQLIILDEPAAGLNDTETAELSGLIRRIREEYGCTILLVEHDMGLVMDVCERICAISFGKLLGIGSPAEIQANKAVQEAYLGGGGEA